MLKQKWFRALFRQRVWVIFLLILQLFFIIFTISRQGMISTVFQIIFKITSLFVSIYVIVRKDTLAEYKLLWLFIILLFPLFGGALYLLFSFQLSVKNLKSKSEVTDEKVKEMLKVSESNLISAQKTIPEYYNQVYYLEKYAGFPVYIDTETFYLSPGEVKFERLLLELEKAEKYIFLEYFIIQEGIMWDTVLEILKRKAKTGVKVRILYDDLGCFMLLPKDYPKLLKKFGIECAIFRPFRPLLTIKQNNRDHRKIVSIDGKVAFTGGINLADEYINEKTRFGHWKDASIMVRGDGAWSLTLIFLQMWEMVTKGNEDFAEYYPYYSEKSKIKCNGFVLPYADSPMDGENVGEQVYLQIIQNAKRYVYINTPYLIVSDKMISALCLAAKSGIDVRIVTPHIGDKWFVHMTTRSYYRQLLHAGVKIYEYTEGFIHSKTFVSDDRIATVGTANLDFRSLYLHFECGVWMCDTSSVYEIKNDYMTTLKSCNQITEDYPNSGFFKRIVEDMLRLFAPLM